MKAISLWQPWASLWCSPAKVHETRHWPTSHRGWLAVHAAKRLEKDFGGELEMILNAEFGHDWANILPCGALVGMVDIVACERTEAIVRQLDWRDYHCGDFSTFRYGWRRDEFIRFAEPVPYRGMQGIFNISDELVPCAPKERDGVSLLPL
jgi:hypothetical protein